MTFSCNGNTIIVYPFSSSRGKQKVSDILFASTDHHPVYLKQCAMIGSQTEKESYDEKYYSSLLHFHFICNSELFDFHMESIRYLVGKRGIVLHSWMNVPYFYSKLGQKNVPAGDNIKLRIQNSIRQGVSLDTFYGTIKSDISSLEDFLPEDLSRIVGEYLDREYEEDYATDIISYAKLHSPEALGLEDREYENY